MGPMAMAAVIVMASSLVNVTLEVSFNALQNWSDVIYQDAFWSRRGITSPDLDRLADEEAEIARQMSGPAFAVGPTYKVNLSNQP